MKHEDAPQDEPGGPRWRAAWILAVVGLGAAGAFIGAAPAGAATITDPASGSQVSFPFIVSGTYDPAHLAANPAVRGQNLPNTVQNIFCADTPTGKPALDPAAGKWSCLVDGQSHAGFVNEQDWADPHFKNGFGVQAFVDTTPGNFVQYRLVAATSTPLMSPLGEVLAGGVLAAGAAGFVVYGSRRRRAGASV